MPVRARLVSIALVLFSSALARGQENTLLKGPRELAAGQSVEVKFNLPKKHSVSVRVLLADADFAGASILTKINGRAMPPYHAFGGDTRYDNVRGKPDMHPPLAKIEANYPLVSDWVVQGENVITITNAGPGKASVEAVSLRDVSGHDLPKYANPIYFDFDVWRQGAVMRPGVNPFLDSMLLGILPGGGTVVMNYTGGDTSPLKLAAEDARVNWGFNRATFYSIWHLATTSKQWAQFIDVDKNPATTGKIHSQFANPPDVPPGTDIAMIKPNGYLDAVKPGIDALLDYSSDYNFTCEQWGARGQGFGWWGTLHADKGYDAKKWADNYQGEFGKLAAYTHKHNPAAPVMAPHWWLPDIRYLLYDTSLARGFKMRDMTDGMMTHYYSFPMIDKSSGGPPALDLDKSDAAHSHPELQYPGGKFEKPDWERSRAYMGTCVLIPEIAIDWNRYRLSRTEKDMKLGDPKVNRWPDGKPFDFRAGFDGDEQSYDNETCIYDRQYSGPAPFQFLYTMFSYSLLPTAGSEPKEFAITRTTPLTPEEPESQDVFTETQQPVNRYGDWVDGAAGTHRLRTKDPLYGDLFGYTGFEQATTGDYIWLCGIKEPHHRRPGADAWNLVRRTCYAFVTSAPVYPAVVNDPDTNNLFVKTLLVKQDGRDVIGVYASNFDAKPHTLDVSLPAPWSGAVAAQLFDETAADWADAKEQQLKPEGGLLHQKASIAAGSAWCLFIYPPPAQVTRAFSAAPVPQPLGPWGNANVPAELTLKWRDSEGAAKYEVQLAKEMLFRQQDVVLTQGDVAKPELKVSAKLDPNLRYHWRVRAIDASGNSSGWSKAQSFWFKAGAGATAATPPTPEAPEIALSVPRVAPVDLKPFTDADNLAHAGTVFSNPNYWEGAGKAIDGNPASVWLPDTTDANEGRKPQFPAWWAVRFDKEQTVSQVIVLWGEGKVGKDFQVQTWDGKAWKPAGDVKGNAAARSTVKLAHPMKTRAVRIWLTAPVATTAGIAEVYVH